MSKVINVRFLAQMPGDQGELYLSAGIPKKAYIRQPVEDDKNKVIWLSARKWKDCYEADVPLKADTTIHVIHGKGKNKTVLFEENMVADGVNVSAEKNEHFIVEQICMAVKEQISQMSLHTQERWARWLQSVAPQYGYSGYADNWLYFGTESTEREIVGTLEFIGVTYSVVATTWKHKVCDKTWRVIEIQNAQDQTVALCGYDYAH